MIMQLKDLTEGNPHVSDDYYVYSHTGRVDDTVFYIGKGRGNRAYTKSDRSKAWKVRCHDNHGFLVDILQSNLSEQQALELEKQFLVNPSPAWDLVNVRKSNHINIITEDTVNNFRYDPTSKSGITKRGKDVGYLSSDGYWVVTHQGKKYYAHRIVMFINNHTFDQSLVVDHIDGNRSNNSLSNLEVVTQAQNCRNNGVSQGRLPSRSNTGCAGISYDKWRNAFNIKYIENGKLRVKYWKIKTDYNEDLQEAIQFKGDHEGKL